MTLGDQVHHKRKKLSLSQEHLAELTGVSVRTIQRIETNATNPRPSTIHLLNKVLELNPTVNDEENISVLKKLIALGLLGIVIPFGNIFFPFYFWKKNKMSTRYERIAKKVISLHIYLTIIFLVILLSFPLLSKLITGSVSIGHFPFFPLIYFIYVISIFGTYGYCIHQLQKKDLDILTKVPLIL